MALWLSVPLMFFIMSFAFYFIGYAAVSFFSSKNNFGDKSTALIMGIGLIFYNVTTYILFLTKTPPANAHFISISVWMFSGIYLWLREQISNKKPFFSSEDSNLKFILPLISLTALAVGWLFYKIKGLGVVGILIDSKIYLDIANQYTKHALSSASIGYQERIGTGILVDLFSRNLFLTNFQSLAIVNFFLAWLQQWILIEDLSFSKQRGWRRFFLICLTVYIYFQQLSWFTGFHGFLGQGLFSIGFVVTLTLLHRLQWRGFFFYIPISIFFLTSYSLPFSAPLLGMIALYLALELKNWKLIKLEFKLHRLLGTLVFTVGLFTALVSTFKFWHEYRTTNAEMQAPQNLLVAGDIHYFVHPMNIIGWNWHKNAEVNNERDNLSRKLGTSSVRILDTTAFLIFLFLMFYIFKHFRNWFYCTLVWVSMLVIMRIIVPFPYAFFKYTSLLSILFSFLTIKLSDVFLKIKFANFLVVLGAILSLNFFVKNINFHSKPGIFLPPDVVELSKIYQDLQPQCLVAIEDPESPPYWNYWMEMFYPPKKDLSRYCKLLKKEIYDQWSSALEKEGVIFKSGSWVFHVPFEALPQKTEKQLKN